MKNKLLIKILYSLALFLALLTVAIFFYPTISDTWNSFVASRIIYDHTKHLGNEKDYRKDLLEAEHYNEDLYQESPNNINHYSLQLAGEEATSDNLSGEVLCPDSYYESMLNIYGDSMMGSLEIPAIHVSLPIYHYTSEAVLAKGIGHLYGSSLPVGGSNTHCVLTGHCGLMSARLFTDLEKMKRGDYFRIKILNRSLYYRVDQIKTILPQITDDLSIIEGKDFVTLITCTPYGINTHRLLVRGQRISPNQTVLKAQAKESRVNPAKKYPVLLIAGIMMTLLLGILGFKKIWWR